MVTFVFSFCLCLFGFCVFCVCGSVDILVVKAKARVLRDLLMAKGGDNRVRSSFSTFFLHFQFSLSTGRRVGGGERDGRNLCIVRLFTFNVLRTFLTLLLSFFLFLQILSICAFYVFSSYDFEYTKHIHSHTHKLMKETKEKMAAHAKNIHTPIDTLEVVCVCPFFCIFLHLYWPLFYENFWRDLILAPS